MNLNLDLSTTAITTESNRTSFPTDVEVPHLVTPTSLTLVLAYLQYYTPNRLPNGRFIAPNHLRQLAAWIDKPDPKLRSLRQHPALVTHLALLYALDYLTDVGPQLVPLPTVAHWLHLPNTVALHLLLKHLNTIAWADTLTRLNLSELITEDLTIYLQQSFRRQLTSVDTHPVPPIQWQSTNETSWEIMLPPTLPNWQQFDLRQLGEWHPGHPLVCTPYSIATAVLRGYSLDLIQWILESAAQEPLPLDRQTQLIQWTHRAHTYQLRTVHLLSTAQPEQTAALMRRKTLRQATVEQISPRHLIVQEEMISKLTTWLRERGYPLDFGTHLPETLPPFTEAQWVWLGTRVLINLGKLTPLPFPPPHAQLETVAKQLSPIQLTNLEAIANTIHSNLQQAIKGQDAFFPTSHPAAETHRDRIQQAIAKDIQLEIQYQALGDAKPTWRTIQPLRLEQHGELYYLTAYCRRAEMNLTFRLDRIKAIKD